MLGCTPPFTVLILLFLMLSGCATTARPWQARTLSGCAGKLGDPALDQERAYLAAILALSERKYAILHSELPREIEAEVSSDHHPEIFHTRWVVRAQRGGSLEIDVPENARNVHEKTESWFVKLKGSVARLQCRDLHWLRWEAQNRGLLPVGAGFAELPSAGAEVPSVAATANLPVSPAQRLERDQHIDSLLEQRQQLHLWRAVAWSGVGVVFSMIGMSAAAQTLSHHTVCQAHPEDCVPRFKRVLGYTALAFGATGAVVLAVALPRTFQRLSKHRVLGREIKRLRVEPISLGVEAHRTAWGLSLQQRF